MFRQGWIVVACTSGLFAVVAARQAGSGAPTPGRRAGQGAPTAQAAPTAHEHGAAAEVTRAVAVLGPLSNSRVSGVVFFTREGNQVHITGRITGLTPGLHAFHVHEFGDLTSADGESAGPHYNPAGMLHGEPNAPQRHAGDFGNIDADGDGVAMIDLRDTVVQLTRPQGILGRGLIVHAGPDKFTQPAGDAGARVGGGVIGVTNPKSALPSGGGQPPGIRPGPGAHPAGGAPPGQSAPTTRPGR